MVIIKKYEGLAETSTVPVSFADTSTIGAAVSGEVSIPTTSTVGVTGITSTIGAAIEFPTTSTIQAGGTVDIKKVTTSTVLWDSYNTGTATYTSGEVDIAKFTRKTFAVYVTQTSTVVVQTTPTPSTAAWYDYIVDNSVPADTYNTFSFSEVQFWARLAVTPSADSTLSAWAILQT